MWIWADIQQGQRKKKETKEGRKGECKAAF
jgi:hypothetical protein